MNRKTSLLKFALVFMLLMTACANVFEPAAGKATDEALFEDAKKLMDKGDFSGSVTKFNSIGAGFASRSEVKEAWVGALAGKCGLNFFSFLQAIGSANLTGSTFMKFLMNIWTGTAIDPASCTAAELKLKSLWATDVPTTSQRLFMSFLAMAKMGAYLRSKADVDGTGGLGNGTADAAFNSCTNANDANHLTDAEVKEIVTGFSLFLQNIVSFSTSLSSDLGNSVTTINTVCGALTPNPCDTADAANVTSGMVDSMRDILKSSTIGIESCSALLPTCCP